jgi:UDP-N-acetylglucosamine 2-epimerase (non-hydrolysing)
MLCVFGTRPEAIKMAPVVQAAIRHPDVTPIVCLTGQHREMLDQVTQYFGISADVDLNLMQPHQTLSALTSKCLSGIADVIETYQPHCVVGQGDTTTAMCAGTAAFFASLPFVHVEAGLRTDDIRSPFPEEFNRRVCSLASALHCAPTETAASNLYREGYAAENVIVTGNTVIDALQWTVQKERADEHRWIEKHADLMNRRMVLITAHRRENHGDGIRNLCDAIRRLAEQFLTVMFVYPVHLNPNIRQPVYDILGGLPNVRLIAPAEYPEFVWLMDRATLILSDSGGVQEEAPSLGKPVLVTRDTTERPEALAVGATRLVGTNPDRVVDEVARLLIDKDAYARMQVDENPYGDGHAAERIVQLISERFAVVDRATVGV